MNFEERDKPIIKNISSNIIRAERAKEYASRIGYLSEIVKEATTFAFILKNRGDFEHSKQYLETTINVNKIITDAIQREYNSVFTSFCMEEEK